MVLSLTNNGAALVMRNLVRQPHLVMFEALPLVVALFGARLVDSSPVRPVVGAVAWMAGMGQCGP